MTHAVAVLVRLTVLAVTLVAYTVLYPLLTPPAVGADIGFGLIAFAGLVIASGAWALVDGVRHGARNALLWWALVAVALALGWWIVFAATQRDSSMSFTELLVSDAGFIPFVMVLVLVPAAVGAAVGSGVRRARVGD